VTTQPTEGRVFIVDDDASIRRALERQLRTLGFAVETFESAQAYLRSAPPDDIACIVSDLRMPGMNGLDFQAALAAGGRALPMVFITGHGDIPSTVQAMKRGAVDFITKPYSAEHIAGSVRAALARSRIEAGLRREAAALQERLASLTPREREVFLLVVEGLLNKVIADRLGIVEKTTKIHRARVMQKMGAASLADLVRMAERLDVRRAPKADP
jgi:FixJ family two-component response regulator